MSLGYKRDVKLSFDEAESRARAALQEQGFGVLSEIDVQATLRSKLNANIRPYKILGACHAPSAMKALSIVPEIGLLLPCNVTISENDDGTITVAAVNAEAMLTVADNPELIPVATEVNQRLRRAIDTV